MIDSLSDAVKEILFRDWDPIGVNDNELCRDEYDSYAPTICRMLQQGADKMRLAQHLRRLQSDSMGMSVIDDELHERIARRLLALTEKG